MIVGNLVSLPTRLKKKRRNKEESARARNGFQKTQTSAALLRQHPPKDAKYALEKPLAVNKKKRLKQAEDDEPQEEADQGRKVVGRWRRDEHDRLLKALEEYGNRWKYVELAVHTRDREQIRSHTQKYFLKLRRRLFRRLTSVPTTEPPVFAVLKEYHNYSGEGLQQPFHERVDWEHLRSSLPPIFPPLEGSLKVPDTRDQECHEISKAEASQYEELLLEEQDLLYDHRSQVDIEIQTLKQVQETCGQTQCQGLVRCSAL